MAERGPHPCEFLAAGRVRAGPRLCSGGPAMAPEAKVQTDSQDVPPEHEEELSCALEQVIQRGVECPSLEIFQSHLDTALCSGMVLLEQGGGTR